MRKVFLLAITTVLLAGSATYAGISIAKKQDCTQCTKGNCTGAKCAECCAHGKCIKG